MKKEQHVANLIAGFGSFKFLPSPIVLSHNSINPKLILYSDYIECRGGFLTRKINYSEIEKIDVAFTGPSTNNIVISKTTGIGIFIGNFSALSQLLEFLKIFESKGCALSEKAKRVIANNNLH